MSFWIAAIEKNRTVNEMMTNICDKVCDLQAVVIAGGKSIRFGTEKGLVRFRGKTLLETAIATAKKLSDNTMVVAARREQYRELDVPIVADLVPGRGPLGGVYTALSYACASLVATLPCDIPLLPTVVYSALLDRTASGCPVVARSHAGLEPLVAVWPDSALPAIREMLHEKKLALYVVLKELNAIDVDISEMAGYQKDWFFNVNTKDDLQLLEKTTGKRG